MVHRSSYKNTRWAQLAGLTWLAICCFGPGSRALTHAGDESATKAASKPSSLPPDAKKEPSALSDGAKPAASSADCAELLAKIRKLEPEIPVIFSDLKRPVDVIFADILTCKEACTDFLSKCVPAPEECEVKSVLCRMEVACLQRYQQDLAKTQPALSDEGRRQAFKAHLEDLIALAKQTAAECPPKSKSRSCALRVLLDLYNKSLQFDKVPETAEALIKEFPDYEYRASVQLSTAISLIAAGRYAEAVKYIQDVLKVNPDMPEVVLFHDKLLDALLGVGDLEGVEDLMHLVRGEYPRRLPLLKEGSSLRNQYEQWLCMSLFWVGFVKMASGDTDGARKTFHEHVAEYENRSGELRKQGKSPSQNDICTITVRYRTEDMLEVLDGFYGKVPTLCFKLDPYWVTEKKLDWEKDCKGKVVVAVFRAAGDQRAAAFLQELDKLVKTHEKEGLIGVTIAHLAGRSDPQADARVKDALREDLKALKVSLPAGFDPDREGQKLFREVHATVGTASVVAFNRKGEIAWFLADPRDMDRGVLRRVVERMLAEKNDEKAK